MKPTKTQLIVTNVAILLVLALLLTSTLYTATAAASSSVSSTNDAYYFGNRNGTTASLMINVYWGTEYIEPMMKVLSDNNVSCTFFIGGLWAEKNHALLKKMSDNGFEIGNHGYLHRDSDKLTQKAVKEEIEITERLIEEVTAKNATRLFAPPSGAIGSNMFAVCRELEYKVIMWTRDTIDWRDHDSNLILQRATKAIKGGDLILMHPTESTLAALPLIIAEFKAQGITLGTVTQTLNL